MSEYLSGKKSVYSPRVKDRALKNMLDPDSFVLSSLLQASPHYLSGSYLAERLNMTRVAIWARVNKLRKFGLSIEASQNRGYRLAGEPDLLVKPLLEAWFKECKIDYPFYLLGKYKK